MKKLILYSEVMQTNITIVIPKLLPQPEWSALKKLLARAKKQKNADSNFTNLLFSLFSLSTNGELPTAAVSGLADGLPTQTGHWLRADPVELRADLAAVYLLGNKYLQLGSADLIGFKQLLDRLFSEDDLVLHTPHPKRWYLQLPAAANIQTHSPDTVLGKDIYTYLPYGPDQTYWRRLFTEVQMVLHEKGTVNALWFWGGGQLPVVNKSHWQKVWTDEATTQGLAQLVQLDSQAVPMDFAHCLAEMNTAGEYLLVMDSLPAALETDWFKPLISALRKGQLTNLRLHLGDHCRYDLSRMDIFKLWKN